MCHILVHMWQIWFAEWVWHIVITICMWYRIAPIFMWCTIMMMWQHVCSLYWHLPVWWQPALDWCGSFHMMCYSIFILACVWSLAVCFGKGMMTWLLFGSGVLQTVCVACCCMHFCIAVCVCLQSNVQICMRCTVMSFLYVLMVLISHSFLASHLPLDLKKKSMANTVFKLLTN